MGARDTAVVGAATMLSRILGFVRNSVVSALFGQTWKADVLNAVFTIPMNLRKLVAEGALSTAFIPVLSQSLAQDPSGGRARQLVRSLFSLQIVVLVPLVALSIVFAPQIIAVLAPFGGVPEKQALAIDLFRWFVVFLIPVSWSAVMMGVENTHQKFLVPALSPLLFSVAVIASLAILAPTWGVYAQIPGVLIGGVLPVVMQWFPLRKLGYSMTPLVRFWIPEMKETLRKWGPALTVSGIALLNQQISITLATTLGEGSTTALSNAIVFWQLPAGVLSASVVTVFFPQMSRQVAEKDWEGASATMVQGLELQALLLIPAGLLLALFAEPVVGLAFQHLRYTYENTRVAAAILSWLSWGLFLSGVFAFLQRFFYAKGDFKTPFRASVVWACSDVAVSVTLMNTPLGVQGLAIGSVAGYGVGALVLLVLAWKDLPRRRLASLLWFLLRIALALVPVVVAFETALGWTGRWWVQVPPVVSWEFLGALGFLALEGTAALVLFGLGLLALGIRPWKLWKGGRP
jgi:putative peptidoglycan lipid II flippase